MSRRHGNEEQEFGSDSFLDIIANIVGILIILIVIAGMKVARQPPESANDRSGAAVAETIARPRVFRSDPAIQSQQLAAVQTELERQSAAADRLLRQSTALEVETAELGAHSASLDEEIASLRARQTRQPEESDAVHRRLKAVSDDSTQLHARIARLTREIDQAEEADITAAQALRRMQQRKEDARLELDEIEFHTRQLREVLEQTADRNVPEGDRLTHRLSPVAGPTSDQELHFRLSSGRIAWVPLEPLLEELKAQVRTRGNVISRFGKYEGVVGPSGGFLMKYIVERQPNNILQSLSRSQGSFRVTVSRWTVKPSDTLMAESATEALKIGSRFRQVVEAADPDATMTVWLYADDFEEFRKIREYCHSLGLRVAARPLPDDADITGSPSGSRSSAQ